MGGDGKLGWYIPSQLKVVLVSSDERGTGDILFSRSLENLALASQQAPIRCSKWDDRYSPSLALVHLVDCFIDGQRLLSQGPEAVFPCGRKGRSRTSQNWIGQVMMHSVCNSLWFYYAE